MPKKPTPTHVADTVVERYLAGALVSTIVEETGLARSTVYAILKRSGKAPLRLRGETDTASNSCWPGSVSWCATSKRSSMTADTENRRVDRASCNALSRLVPKSCRSGEAGSSRSLTVFFVTEPARLRSRV